MDNEWPAQLHVQEASQVINTGWVYTLLTGQPSWPNTDLVKLKEFHPLFSAAIATNRTDIDQAIP